jgi:hypothetical protein
LEELRETYQFEKTPKIMNEIDQMKAILDAISRDTNLWVLKKKSKYNTEILDALWAWGKITKTNGVVNIPNPQMCDVRTGIWQEIVNERLERLETAQLGKDKKKKPKVKFVIPKKINTKISADLSNLQKDTKLINRLGRFFSKIKRIFTRGAAERNLAITYKLHGKEYFATFRPENNVILDTLSKKEIPKSTTIDWQTTKTKGVTGKQAKKPEKKS